MSDSALLRVGAALPDPPFELPGDGDGGATGFDVGMMQAVAARLGRRYELVRYTGGDFDGIFAGLDAGDYDAVAVAKADATLADEIDRALDALRADGTLTTLGGRWLQTRDPSSGTTVIT